jgi:16S rRNA G1207 methylase RsmC
MATPGRKNHLSAVAWLPAVSRWHVGLPRQPVAPGREEGVVAFTAAELAVARESAARALGFHEAIDSELPPAAEVAIHFPAYRSRTLAPVLSWLAITRLATPDARVSWHLDKQQGPDSFARLLEGLGWKLERERKGQTTVLAGRPAKDAELPPPREFTARLGSREAILAADYGVFSAEHVDEGTELLLGIALAGPTVSLVADIGTGYGPLAVGLLLNGVAGTAVGTEVDCIALWLAARNARRNQAPLTLLCTPDPADAPPSDLTVCAVPTHINRPDTERLMAGLAARARRGRLLITFHSSLEERYTNHLERAGLSVRSHPGAAHVVLESGPPEAARRRRAGA